MQRATDPRQLLGESSHAMVFAQLTLLDGAAMIAILLPSASVESPCLNGGARTGGDVHITPGRWNSQRLHPRERSPIAYRTTIRIDIWKSGALRSEPANPRRSHTVVANGQERFRHYIPPMPYARLTLQVNR